MPVFSWPIHKHMWICTHCSPPLWPSVIRRGMLISAPLPLEKPVCQNWDIYTRTPLGEGEKPDGALRRMVQMCYFLHCLTTEATLGGKEKKKIKDKEKCFSMPQRFLFRNCKGHMSTGLGHFCVFYPMSLWEVESESTSESSAFPVWFPTTLTSHSPDGTEILKQMVKITNAFKHRLNCFYWNLVPSGPASQRWYRWRRLS